ncbi:neprilysin-11-like isoform X2 [Ornithodoros turicata]|uniref:neprilysin-11-like isoform X2 n=1 Tax=Ornithodoros turicata TaxID=34597 RepID=UPI003138705A
MLATSGVRRSRGTLSVAKQSKRHLVDESSPETTPKMHPKNRRDEALVTSPAEQGNVDEEQGFAEETTTATSVLGNFLNDFFKCFLRYGSSSLPSSPRRQSRQTRSPHREPGYSERHPSQAGVPPAGPSTANPLSSFAVEASPATPTAATGDSAAATPARTDTILDKPSTQIASLTCVLLVGAAVTLFHTVYIRTWPDTYAGHMRHESESQETRPRYWKEDQWRLADMYRKTMNRAVDPCTNFQEFVCGRSTTPTLQRLRYDIQKVVTKVLKQVEIAASEQTSLEKAAALYKLCMNVFTLRQNSLTDMRKFMSNNGIEWPTSDNSSFPTLEGLLDVLVDLSLNWSLHPFFRLSVEPEPTPNGRVALLLVISPDMQQWSIKRKELLRRGLYHDFLCRHVSAYLGRGRQDEFESLVRALQHADTRVASALFYTRSSDALTSPVRLLKENEAPLPQMPGNVFRKALQRHFDTNFTITAVDANTQFLEQLSFFLTDSPKIAQNYLAWYALRYLGPAASHEIISASFILESANTVTEPSWSHFCYTEVLSAFPLTVGLAYSQGVSTISTGRSAVTIARTIQNSLVDLLVEDDKQDLAQQVRSLRKIISLPIAPSTSKHLYKNVPDITVGESFFRAWLRTRKATGDHLRSLLGQLTNVDILSHLLVSVEVRPFYYAPYHAIVIPVGALQQPLFGETLPVAINYGAFGRMVARVMLESVATRSLTASRICMRRAMGLTSFTSRRRELEVAMKLTESELPLLRAVEEGTPDLTQREERLFGFQEFTAVQAMYIAGCYATCGDPMSRCDVFLKQSARFAQVFNCSHRTAMNPQEKCALW